jgi:hypothetical protein
MKHGASCGYMGLGSLSHVIVALSCFGAHVSICVLILLLHIVLKFPFCTIVALVHRLRLQLFTLHRRRWRGWLLNLHALLILFCHNMNSMETLNNMVNPNPILKTPLLAT